MQALQHALPYRQQFRYLQHDHEAIENAGDITLTMMVSGVASDNDFETEQLPKLVKEKWPKSALKQSGEAAFA